jgi:tetratricopeptide (TPR) repeat protein
VKRRATRRSSLLNLCKSARKSAETARVGAGSSAFDKIFIEAVYNKEVTGDVEKAEQACDVAIEEYPRARKRPLTYLAGAVLPVMGKYEKALKSAKEAIELKPDISITYAFVIFNAVSLNRLADADAVYKRSLEQKVENPDIWVGMYEVAFLRNDTARMKQLVEESSTDETGNTALLGMEADTAGYGGKVKKARELSLRSINVAKEHLKEAAALHTNIAALREAVFGNADAARKLVVPSVPNSTARDVRAAAAMALAFAGDAAGATKLASDLDKDLPEDLIVQRNYLPTVRGAVALEKGDASGAIASLDTATRYELGQTTESNSGWNGMYPVYVRGEAYLAAKRGTEAAGEFQKILAHRGIVFNEPIAATARVGLARAYAMQGDSAKARAAYEDFFALWKDADGDVPVLVAAKAEYARLK